MLVGPAGLEFKAYEIEELADVYFFRPFGMLFARAARALRLTPSAVTMIGAGVGVLGGALLYDERLGLAAFALIILHGVLDSSDGQLARMTGQVTELGRVLDGVGGYLTHAAIYIAILAGSFARGGGEALVLWAVVAAIANVVQAQMYDYHRSVYAQVVINGTTRRPAHAIAGAYEAMERRLAGLHPRVERVIAERATNGRLRDEDRARYRSCFYWPVRGWNLLGDNTRFYAIGVLAWLHHLDWFFAFLLLPMNGALVTLWLWQARADRRFLAARG